MTAPIVTVNVPEGRSIHMCDDLCPSAGIYGACGAALFFFYFCNTTKKTPYFVRKIDGVLRAREGMVHAWVGQIVTF